MYFENKINDFFESKKKDFHHAEFKEKSCIETLQDKNKKLACLTSDIEIHGMASSFIQSIIDIVCDSNLRKIEKWVNLGLKNIFDGQVIEFKINKTISRNVNLYSFSILNNGIEGGINSFGGGVVCVISLILKILFLEITKSFKILVLDESLSFLSTKYIENCSKFINTLVNEFKLSVVLVTHQDQFKNYTSNIYEAKNKGTSTIFEKYEE